MKKMMKALAAILAVVLLLSLSLTAFADELGVLTISGDQIVGKTITAVRMFSVSWLDNNNNQQIGPLDTLAYSLEDAWEDFFENDSYFNGKSLTGTTTSEKAFNYLKNLEDDSAELNLFVQAAARYYRANAASFSSLQYERTMNVNPYTISNMIPGYYLVLPEMGSTSTSRQTDAILVNVPSAKSVTLQLKSQYPTVSKTVDDTSKKETSAQIGDTVTFTLTSAVPDMSEYSTYYFEFRDTLSDGLDYVNGSASVQLGGADVDSGDYTLNYNGTTRVLTVVFDDLKSAGNATTFTAGTAFTVSYQAILNENAIVGGGGNVNEAVVIYQNGPQTIDHGTSTPSDAKVYTYPIEIHKYHDSDIAQNRLAGAVFSLKDAANTDNIKLVATATEGIYRVATAAEIADTTVTKYEQITTGTSGTLVIQGLEAGTYYLHEIAAPTGYNKLTAPIKVVIAPKVENGVTDYTIPTYSIKDAAATTSNVIPVENKSGSVLPSTGSIGTIGLTILGVLLVIGGVLLSSKKKKQKKDQA